MISPRYWQTFFELYEKLPRQGPGNDDSTLRALAMIPELPPAPRVLDLGCGTGMPTLTLARALPRALIVALDSHRPFLRTLARSAAEHGVRSRVRPIGGDMNAIPCATGTFDLLWSEGAAYCAGIPEALRAWRRVLRPEGSYLVFSEANYFQQPVPAEVIELWRAEYPAITTENGTLERIGAAGYTCLGHFRLPREAWWSELYAPMRERIASLRKRYAADEEALAWLEEWDREPEQVDRGAAYCGYTFYVTAPATAD